MTDSNYAHVLMIVDRSGSMHQIREDAEGGIKSFFEGQRDLRQQDTDEPIHVTVSLAQFNHEFDWVKQSGASLDDVADYTLVPSGRTALLDAIGTAVVEDGEWLASLPEDERPGKVVCVIVTDGLENSSREWTLERVKELVEGQQSGYDWQFVFLAADIESIQLGQNIGITTTTQYPRTHRGTRMVYGQTQSATVDYFTGKSETVRMPETVDDQKTADDQK